MAFNVRNTNPKALTEVLPYPEIEKVYDIRIPLPDGNYIHAHAWTPKRAFDNLEKSYATLIEYIPYRTDVTVIRDSIRHPYYADHGFISMRVDMRGSCNSSGVLEDEYLPIEQEDALAVFDWIVAQPWSNGNIGMFGKSWAGFNGLQVAARQHPALKTIITLMSTDDRYSDDVHYRGGCLLASDMLWWGSTMSTYQPRPQDPLVVGKDWKENWLKRLDVPPMLNQWMAHQTRDDYWKHGSVCEDWSLLEVPVLAIGGFRDGYTNPVWRMAEKLPNPESCCIVGPWVHEYPEMAEPAPKIDYQQLSTQWFTKWLYPNKNDQFSLPRLTVYIQDPTSIAESYVYREGTWISTNKPNIHKYITFNLTDELRLKRSLGDTVKELAIPFSGSLSHGLFRGTWCPFGFKGDFPGDQRYEDSKCLCFDSDIFENDIDLCGLPFIKLGISSDKKLANVSVRLVDIYPSEESVLLSWGQLNLTHRNSHEFPEFLQPKEKYDVKVSLDSVGIKLKKGHKLRIALSPCDWPQAWPSPETPTLMLHYGLLYLPVPDDTTLVEAPIFGKPSIVDSPLELVKERPYGRKKKVEYDYELDEWKLTDIQDGGCTKINRNGYLSGFYFGEYNKNEWKIRMDDPSSACNRCEWVYEMGRNDWKIRIETETELTADSADFYLITKRRAYEDDKQISEREFREKYARKFI